MKRLLLSLVLLAASAMAGAQNCAINPGACQPKPTPSACPAGKHWTTLGSGIAHCVADDPVCAGTVTHDSLGNPTGCTPTVVSSTTEYQYFDCNPGYSGTDFEKRTVTKYSDGTTKYGSWQIITYSCSPASTPTTTPTPTPTCSNGASDYPTCTPPATSTPTPTPTPTCSNGASDYPTCTPPVTSTPAPAPTCSNGASDYPTCTPPPAPTCANGATNYPTCTLAVEPTLTCPYAGQTKYGCTAGATGSTGKYMATKYTDNGLGDGGCNTKSTQVGTCGYNPGFWFKEY